MKRYIIYNICIAVLLSFISCSEGLQEIEEVGAPAELLMLSTESINAGSVKGSYKIEQVAEIRGKKVEEIKG